MEYPNLLITKKMHLWEIPKIQNQYSNRTTTYSNKAVSLLGSTPSPAHLRDMLSMFMPRIPPIIPSVFQCFDCSHFTYIFIALQHKCQICINK